MKALFLLPIHPQLTSCFGLFPTSAALSLARLKTVPGLQVESLGLEYGLGLDPLRTLGEALEYMRPQVVLAWGPYEHWATLRGIFQAVKTALPEAATVSCGPLNYGDPEAMMEVLEFADYGAIGYAENILPGLLSALANGAPPDRVAGLIVKTPEGLRLTEPDLRTPDWSRLPFGDYEGFGAGDYLRRHADDFTSLFALRVALNAGCTHQCTFCYCHLSRGFSQRPLQEVYREMKVLAERYGPRFLSLSAFLSAASRSDLRALADMMTRLGPRQYWSATLRVPQIDEEVADMLRESGCRSLGLGLESVNPAILKSMKKGISREQTERALEVSLKAGLTPTGSLIFGDPAETWDSARETIAWWRDRPQYLIFLAPLLLFPGSELYQRAVTDGRIPDRADFIRQGMPPINMSTMSDEEYAELRRQLNSLNEERFSDPGLQPPELETVALNYTDGTRDIAGVCPGCGRRMLNRALSVTGFQARCPHCGRFFFLPPASGDRAQARHNLELLLAKYGRVAFWGIGRQFARFMDAETVNLPNVHLLDRHSGRRFGPKLIEPPETIAQHRIDCVITMPPVSPLYAEIRAEAQRYGVTRLADFEQIQRSDFES